MSDSDWWSDDILEEDNEFDDLPVLGKAVSYEVMSESEIAQKQAMLIEKLADQFGLTRTQAAQLLIQHEWNLQKSISACTDSNALEHILLERSISSMSPPEETTCITCFTVRQGSEMLAMECGHYFCKFCYSEYLKEALNSGMLSVFTECPMDNCELIVPEDLYKELLPQDLFKRYKRFLLKSYVELSKAVKWCPAPGCEYAASYPKMQMRNIMCQCGYSWCFKCGNDSHRPLDCETLAKWKERDEGGQEDEWILANTKPCPFCGSNIQKNLGCMHMTCFCGREFCWLCLGDWAEHGSNTGGFYDCNRFRERQQRGEYSEEEKKRATAALNVERYNHYFSRYVEHKRSTRLAKIKKTKLQEQINHVLSMLTDSYENLEFLLDSLNVVIECRSIICYSYPLAFFLSSPSKLKYFEYLQGEMEKHLETLDKKTDLNLGNFLENDDTGRVFLTHEFFDTKSFVIGITEMIKELFDKNVKDIEEGLTIVQIQDDEISDEQLNAVLSRDLFQRWTCPSCTFSNGNERTNCEICNTARPN